MKKLMSFILVFATGLTLAACGNTKTADKVSTSPVKNTDSYVNKTKTKTTSKGTYTYEKDTFTAKDFKIKITGVEATQDSQKNPAVFIKYTFTTTSKDPQIINFVWPKYVKVTQVVNKKTETLLPAQFGLATDKPTANETLLENSSKSVSKGKSEKAGQLLVAQGKGKLKIRFLNKKGQIVGIKTVEFPKENTSTK